jgi:NADPH:quinone reductase-like Zn-dependent oxidoreductase
VSICGEGYPNYVFYQFRLDEILVVMKELLEAGAVVPVIDKCYPLSQGAEAFRYFGEGHAKGKVVITMEQKGA